jgi:hypothetical protein
MIDNADTILGVDQRNQRAAHLGAQSAALLFGQHSFRVHPAALEADHDLALR